MTTLNVGSGADGVADATTNVNIATESLVGRPYGDMVSYQCTAVGASSCEASATPNGIAVGDEVLLMNWQGVSSDYNVVGNFETFIVDSIISNTINFTTSKTKFFGATSGTDSCTGGAATASAYSGANVPSRAFDDNTGTYWQYQGTISGSWLQYVLTSAQTIIRYNMTNHTFTNQTPNSWTLQGWDGTAWVVVDTRSGESGWTSIQTRTYNCNGTLGDFDTYRFVFSSANGSNDEMIIADIDMFEATDTNIGTSSSNQRVIIQRVPQYTDLTIDNGVTLTGPDAWDTFGGALFLRATGTILVNGTISMKGKGYTGGYNNWSGSAWYYRTGASYNGGPRSAVKGSASWFTASNLGGGARGGWNGSKWACGAGGGYGTVGEDGDDTNNVPTTQGGSTYGEQTLSKLFSGSGGGSGEESGEEAGDVLADGGGIIALFCGTLDVYGDIICDGQTSVPVPSLQNQPGGAGAGGSILIHAGTIYTRSSTFTAIGAIGDTTPQPGVWKGGDGGDGRIAISYATLGDNVDNVDPTPYTDGNLQLPYSVSGTVSSPAEIRVYDSDWNFIKAVDSSGGTYEVLNLPNSGPFFVVAIPNSSSLNAKIYRDVSGIQ